MTDYTVISKVRNKTEVNYLVNKLGKKGKTCYNFCDTPAIKDGQELTPEEQMEMFENTKDFYNDKYFQKLFKQDLDGLRDANKVIVLLPAGNSVHIEAGIAYGLGKELILIGEVEKPETLYLIFDKRYKNIEEFLNTVK